MDQNYPDRCVVVGVTPTQPSHVLQHATRFAQAFSARLVCAHVDTGRYVVAEHADGTVNSRPIDPDLPDWESEFDPDLRSRIESLAGAAGVRAEYRELAGDVARALGRLAEVLAAELIVVGSRRGGFRASVQEFLGGSVAAHLAHRQPRPVVVVPVAPVPAGSQLPWEAD